MIPAGIFARIRIMLHDGIDYCLNDSLIDDEKLISTPHYFFAFLSIFTRDFEGFEDLLGYRRRKGPPKNKLFCMVFFEFLFVCFLEAFA
jgi:hypothetical protein